MNTWQSIIDLKNKDTRHRGVANDLRDDEIETIVATVDFFGGNIKQTIFDLRVARFRVFDWVAMLVMGNRVNSIFAVKVLAHSFLKSGGDVDLFIDDLRFTDYELDNSWEKIEL